MRARESLRLAKVHPSCRSTRWSRRKFRGRGTAPPLNPRRARSVDRRDGTDRWSGHGGHLALHAAAPPRRAHAAEEAVQETFLLAWRGKDRVDPGIGSLRSRLFAILRDVLVNIGRAPAAQPPVADGGVEGTVERLEQSLLAWQVEEAMRRISEPHRRVLVETFYRGRSYAEVGTELGIPEGAMKSCVNDGLRRLRVALEEVAIEGCKLRERL